MCETGYVEHQPGEKVEHGAETHSGNTSDFYMTETLDGGQPCYELGSCVFLSYSWVISQKTFVKSMTPFFQNIPYVNADLTLF